jgi:hypothetical protein
MVKLALPNLKRSGFVFIKMGFILKIILNTNPAGLNQTKKNTSTTD